jgi:SulP family sulfate permease
LFPRVVVRGIQLSIGLILFRKGIEMVFSRQTFISEASRFPSLAQFPLGILLAVLALLIFILAKFVFPKQSERFPPSLVLLSLGLVVGVIFSPVAGFDKLSPALPGIVLPGTSDFWLALTVLVIPQLPLTLGNAVVGTWNTTRTYFQDKAQRMTPRALTTSMGLANIAAGLLGAMPMCHGSGGLTAHYKLGARTGGANLMVGGLLLALGALFGSAALSLLSLIPLAVLGVLLTIVGLHHASLIRDLTDKRQLAVAGTVAVVTIVLGNLAYGFGAGIILHHLLRLLRKRLTLLPGVVKLSSRAQ